MTSIIFIQGGGPGAFDADHKLAQSLERELGGDIPVDFPRVPGEDDPDYERWQPVISTALARASDPVVLVGHSLGAHFLLRYLVTERVDKTVLAVCLISTPFPSGDPDWTFEGFELPDDFQNKLPKEATVFLYASVDDETVSFAHRDLYAAAIPRAETRTTTGGHQVGNDLAMVAADILRITTGPASPGELPSREKSR